MLVSIAIRIEVFPVQYGADLLGLSVDNTQGGAVLKESHLVTIRRV